MVAKGGKFFVQSFYNGMLQRGLESFPHDIPHNAYLKFLGSK